MTSESSTHIEADFRHFLSSFQSIEPFFIPISALAGRQRRHAQQQHALVPWPEPAGVFGNGAGGQTIRNGPVPFPGAASRAAEPGFRGYAGTVASGKLKPGDPITVLPSGRTTSVASITTFDGDLDAGAGRTSGDAHARR